MYVYKYMYICICICIRIFILSVFSSTNTQILTIQRTAGEERGPNFIRLYHFYWLKSIQIFSTEMTSDHLFLIASLATTRLLLDELCHVMELLFD